MAEFLVIREVIQGIRTYSCPFTRMGVMPIGGRSTAVRLSDNKSVLVVASTPMTDATRASVDELGAVKYLIAPDAEHYLFLKDWAAVYPDARICGVERHIEAAGVPITGVWGRDPNPLGDDPVVNADFTSEFVSGHVNKEVALVHKPSGTLIQADLLFNLPANEQYSAPGAGKPTGGLIRYIFDPASLNPYSSKFQSMVYNQLARDKKQVAHSAQVIASWEFDRIIPCHGDVIETGGKEAWRSSFKKFFDDIAAGKFEKYVPNATATSAPAAEQAPLVTVTPAAEGATTPKVPTIAPDVAPAPGAAPTAA